MKKIAIMYEFTNYWWCDKFIDKHNRQPLKDEIVDNLQDKMNPDILNKIINKILESYDKIENTDEIV